MLGGGVMRSPRLLETAILCWWELISVAGMKKAHTEGIKI